MCERLDQLYAAAGRTGSIPSELFRGALYVMQPAQRARNPDWMAQSAHSLRELLYPFTPNERRDALSRYGAAGDADTVWKDIGVHYGFMTSVAHHQWDRALKNPFVTGLITDTSDRVAVYEAALSAFENVLFQGLRRQLDVHAEIDAFVSEARQDPTALRKLLTVNFDAKRYFFAVASEQSLEWLRENGFLSDLRRPRDAVSKDSPQIPELTYLTRLVPSCAERIVDIMLITDVSDQEPELLNGFLWIAQSISAEHLTRLLPKLRDEGWPRLSARFSLSEFSYRRDEYWSQVLDRFGGDRAKKTAKDLGWKVLSSSYAGLTDEQRVAAQEAFGRPLNPSFTAAPALRHVQGGWVSPRAPATL